MVNINELIEIFKDKEYFTDSVRNEFNFENKEEFDEFIGILKELVEITQDEMIYKNKNKNLTVSGKIELKRKEFLENFEEILQSLGLIYRKSRKYSAETNIGKLYKYLVDEKSRNIYKKIDETKKKSFKEKDLYGAFEKILRKMFNMENISICRIANLGISGTWVNPDILVKFGDFYYSYELKRWKNISPLAPHEARNHARYISNYPYVVINVPQKIFDFVINYVDDFQIIKNDCRERGIGLILFDEVNDKFLKLLDASYFTPDPLKKIKYEKLLKEKCMK